MSAYEMFDAVSKERDELQSRIGKALELLDSPSGLIPGDGKQRADILCHSIKDIDDIRAALKGNK